MAKAIMIQGTMSNVGKSLLSAALCRIFWQDGYRAAPFKAQNMALNAGVTPDGREIGRAQVMQAEAAGIAPTVEMNPILLKPTSEVGSQVVVLGQARGTTSAREYYALKHRLWPAVEQAYHRLDAAYDIIVIEGAGSPAEINLKASDIANMRTAKLAQAPVLLVGDIDRGGVFAQLLGTMALLDADERQLVKGLVINKFRGDQTLLQPGLAMLEERVRRPVLGVVPHLTVDIDDEDSLSARLQTQAAPEQADVAVIYLPRLSNFTDFAPLERLPGVSLRYVRQVEQLGQPDLIILPGSKNTLADLSWLRAGGLEGAILRHAAQGGLVLGICGGYQMLGQRLHDPAGNEGGGSLAGLGLLPVETVFGAEKTTRQTAGTTGELPGPWQALSRLAIQGYEIHQGRTMGSGEAAPFAQLSCSDGGPYADGAVCGQIAGTYLHGLFDDAVVTERLAQLLYQRKGLRYTPGVRVNQAAYKAAQYDRLADGVRQGLDMARIYAILEAGV